MICERCLPCKVVEVCWHNGLLVSENHSTPFLRCGVNVHTIL